MTEERKIQLGVTVNASGAREGLAEVGQSAREMATSVAQAAGAAGHAVDGIGNGGDAAAKKVSAAERSLIGSIQRTTAAMDAGSRSSAQYYEVLARQRGVDPSALRPYLAQLEEVQARQNAASGALQNGARSLDTLGVSAKQTAAAMRGVPAQFTDIITSLQGGQQPLTVLLQQGGQLKDMFGGIGNAAKALGTYVAGLISPFTLVAGAVVVAGVAYAQSTAEAQAYTKALALSGNAAGTTAGQLADMARRISSTVGTQGAAAEALAALAGTGRVSAANLEQFATVAIKSQRALGESVADTAKDFADLAKTPLQALDHLNEKYPFLTAAIYEQVKALTEQGRAQEAGTVAQKAYADATDGMAAKVQENLGTMEKAWVGLKDIAKSGWDAMLGLGRQDTLEQQLAAVREKIKKAQTVSDFAVGSLALKGDLPANIELEKSLERQISDKKRIADLDAFKAEFNAADLAWSKGKDQFLTRQEQKERDIAKVRNEGIAAGVSDVDIEKRVAKVTSGYADLNNAAMAATEVQRKIEQDGLKASEADLDSSFKRKLIGEDAYINAKRDLQLKEIDGEIALTKKKAAIAGDKEDKSEQIRLLGDIQLFAAQRNRIIAKANNDILDSYAKTAEAVDAQVTKWANATADEQSQLAGEVALFGKSAEARAVSSAEIKIEAEARQFLDDIKKRNGLVLPDETAEILLQAEARKKNAAAAINENAALAGAAKLHEENQKFGVQYIADEETRAARLLEIDADVWRKKIANAEEGSAAQKLLQQEFETWYANRQLAPVLDRWKDVISSLDRNFSEGFRNMLNNGKSAWSSFAKSIGDTLKTALADAIYQTFIKKYVIQIVTSFAGAISGPSVASILTGSPASGTGSGGGNSAIGLAQSAKGIYDAISGGFSSLSTSVADAVQSGLYSTGLSPNIASNGAFANGVGSAASVGAGLIGGHYLGNAISGEFSIGNHGQAVVNTGAAVGAIIGSVVPVLGTALGALIGGALGGLTNRLFGMGEKQLTSETLTGSFGSNGFTGNNIANWHQNGGWFRSDKNGTDTKPVDDTTSRHLADVYNQIKSVSADFATTLGIDASGIAARTQTLSVALTKDAAANEKALADFFTTVSNTIANELVPSLSDFAKTGEAASATLQRLAIDYKATDEIAKIIGKTTSDAFGAIGLASVAARERLVDLSGGVEALLSKSKFYTQNFLTEAEKIAPVIKAVSDAMGGLGLSGVTTVEQFKAEIRGLDLSTEAGAKEFAALMDLAPAFKTAADYTEQLKKATEDKTAADRAAADALASSISKEQQSLDIELMRAMGNAEGALAAERREALAALLTDQARTTQTRIWAEQDAQAVIAKAREQAAKTAEQVSAAIAAMTARQQQNADALQGIGSEFASMITKSSEAAKSLRAFNEALLTGSASPLDAEGRYKEAKRQFEDAQHNGSPAELQAAGSALLSASQARGPSATSGLEYARDFAAVRLAMGNAASTLDRRITTVSDWYRGIMSDGAATAARERTPRAVNLGGTDTAPTMTRTYSAQQAKSLRAPTQDTGAQVKALREEMTLALSSVAASTSKAADSLDDLAAGRKVLKTEAAT